MSAARLLVSAKPWKPTVSTSGVTTSAPRKSPIHQLCTASQNASLPKPGRRALPWRRSAHSQRGHQRRGRETQHMAQPREGDRTAHADVHEPTPSIAAANFTGNSRPAPEKGICGANTVCASSSAT